MSFGQNSSEIYVNSCAIEPDPSSGKSEANSVVHHMSAVEGSSSVNLSDLRFSFLRRSNVYTRVVYIDK